MGSELIVSQHTNLQEKHAAYYFYHITRRQA